jgi:hypothetical protein
MIPCHPALRSPLRVVKIRLSQVVNFRLSLLHAEGFILDDNLLSNKKDLRQALFGDAYKIYGHRMKISMMLSVCEKRALKKLIHPDMNEMTMKIVEIYISKYMDAPFYAVTAKTINAWNKVTNSHDALFDLSASVISMFDSFNYGTFQSTSKFFELFTKEQQAQLYLSFTDEASSILDELQNSK